MPECLHVRVAREGDDHPLDVVVPDDLGQIGGLAEDRQVAEVLVALARVLVDEADHVDAVLGVVEQLPRDPLPDVARPDDQRVLRVGVGAAGRSPRAATRATTTSGIASARKVRIFESGIAVRPGKR